MEDLNSFGHEYLATSLKKRYTFVHKGCFMRGPQLAGCAIACSFCALAQVTVQESSTRAHLVDGKTTISLAIRNGSTQALHARLELELLAPDNQSRGLERRSPQIQPGDSVIEVPLPLSGKYDPLFDRLRYHIRPGEKNYTAFPPLTGIISFAHIADYAFTMTVVTADRIQPGKLLDIHVMTLHPVSGRPVTGVQVASSGKSATSGPDGVALLRVQVAPDGDERSFDIEARLGDFVQTGETAELPVPKTEVRIYTDKPLYQPGQTLHVRILARGPDLQARAGAEYKLRILDRENKAAHSARVITSRFGITSTDWQIPSNAVSGSYTIEVKAEELEAPVSRAVEIRPYELPSFRVKVKPDRPYYLEDQPAVVEIRAEYLFGKPVTSGRVRVTEDDVEEALLAGNLDADGLFRGTIAAEDLPNGARFEDRHFTAYVTDASTNRTEQRKFDLRISRDTLHVYVPRMDYSNTGRRLYVTTYTPDGKPASSTVEILNETKLLGTGITNRFGLARIDIPEGAERDLEVRAVTRDGKRGHEDEQFYETRPVLRLETSRSLYRAGEPVQCDITSTEPNPTVLLLAWNDSGLAVFSRRLTLTGGRARITIPYDRRFGRRLSLGVVSGAEDSTATRAVLFLVPGELVVQALPAKTTYRPGETASIRFQSSAETALGVAIVDQSVLKRVSTDAAFKSRHWFDHEPGRTVSLGGVTEKDLENLDPSRIDADLQLVAEFLIRPPNLGASASEFTRELFQAFHKACGIALEPVRRALDDDYLRTLRYPRDQASLPSLLPGKGGVRDPWMQPYQARFETVGANDVLRLVSGGPDKQLNTDDDFTALVIRRPWFGKFSALIRETLDALPEFPSTREGFLRALDAAGIRFDALRDPWGSPLQVELSIDRKRQAIRILSSGPDRTFGTGDDADVAHFEGEFFAPAAAKIDRALSGTQPFPQSAGDFRAVLRAAGIDFDALRDPWGRPYYTLFRTQEVFGDQVRLYSYAEFGGPREERKQITPVKRTMLALEIHSLGEDGAKDTKDDFEVATFVHVLATSGERQEDKAAAPPGSPSRGGLGSVAGVVTDQTGAVISGVEVTLNGELTTRTSASGWYLFRELKPGHYRLRFEMAGFRASVIDQAPVRPYHLTRVNTMLYVGEVTETITVQAEPMLMMTDSAQVRSEPNSAATLATPRVREYFPETLYWQPELITDKSGRASIDVKLADSITTWHVAVIGSTEDGRIAESSADIRAFQPFMVDLDVPPVLTAGDEIALPAPVRNYLDRAQTVAVSVAAPKPLALTQPVRQPGPIAPGSSGNTVLALRAEGPTSGVRLRVTAVGGQASDAIEKPVAIHHDGERKEATINAIGEDGRQLRLNVPSAALPGSIRAEVKFYPSLLARVLESAEALLQRPYGCAEQTISSAYPNLLFLKAMKDAGLKEDRLEAKAMKNLRTGYEKLLGYQTEEGGFSYWGRGNADVAVTAYALSFLWDAGGLIEIDADRRAKAKAWLAAQNVVEGAVQSLQVRALAQAGPNFAGAVDSKLGDMARSAAKFEDPYELAAFALAAMDAGKPDLTRSVIQRLIGMAQNEQGAAYWSLRANTPFHGWGRAGQVETTALVVSALSGWRKGGDSDAALATLIERGALFLLKNADRGGAWTTTQSTVRALTALLDTSAGRGSHPGRLSLSVNGVPAGEVAIPGGPGVHGAITHDISSLVKPGMANEVSVAAAGLPALQMQFNAAWYEPWKKARQSPELRLETRYSTLKTSINQPVACDVVVSRPHFRGYGMVIAEIGLPPGAEVDRGTLDSLVGHSKTGVDSYEVAPDHVTFYLWPRAADSRFRFVFRPRFAMHARAAQSVLYDYYNPDERSVLPPERFTVEE